jgi:3-hydroxymyristoyl/3-hydroxydecanoyl-(acyl carrier protein) dehydratase
LAKPSLVDVDAVDLTRVLHGIDEIRLHCKQRGRMEMLEGIVHEDMESGLVVGFRDIRADDWWAADHIPGRPIFPGVLQAEGAAQLCSFDFLRRHPALQGKFVGFAGLNDTRFRGMVEPGVRLHWAGKVHRVRSTMFTYKAEGFVGRDLVFETEIMGVIM